MPLKNKRSRRLLALALLIAGGLLMWLAPERLASEGLAAEAQAGIALLAAGVILEIVGIMIERRAGG